MTKSRLTFVGRIIRMPNSKIPVRLISATYDGNRPLVRLNFTIIHSILNDIKKIILTIDKDDSFLSSAYLVYVEMTWSMLINTVGSDSFKIIPEQNGEIPPSPVKSPSYENFSDSSLPQTPSHFSPPPQPSPPPSPIAIFNPNIRSFF